jgi:hypothetical protein
MRQCEIAQRSSRIAEEFSQIFWHVPIKHGPRELSFPCADHIRGIASAVLPLLPAPQILPPAPSICGLRPHLWCGPPIGDTVLPAREASVIF